MKTKQLIVILLTVCTVAFGESKIEKATSSIVKEGKLLYRSEMASWYGTDLFLEKFGERRENIGGYFSYTESNLSKCIFFSKSENPKVIGTISFDSTYNVNTAKIDGGERSFTKKETDIYTIRKIALNEIQKDTLFKKFNNTELNLIPLTENGENRVYVLTGPKSSGVVIIGNDYLLTFNSKNELTKKKQLHRNILPMKYDDKQQDVATIHNHLLETGDFITATDVCTLLLYEKFAKWKQHYVTSENYVSIWNCETDQLLIITRKAWEKIYKDQEKYKKDQLRITK